ncbi:hypothetical protein HAX54_038661 [Datura stramonium]|uniref:Uncharacterized protein n=1 Tax=Datura stramonium TaxID=4076 RepID=A0ABS8SIL7_DATST|nr:hypothetical protein [Datura stramonium]
MAKNTTFVALLLCLLLVAATEMQMAEGKYCWKKNHKWHGPCQYSYKCSQHCKHWFGAQYAHVLRKIYFLLGDHGLFGQPISELIRFSVAVIELDISLVEQLYYSFNDSVESEVGHLPFFEHSRDYH